MASYNTIFPWGVQKRVAPKGCKAVCISLSSLMDIDGNTLDDAIRVLQSWKIQYSDVMDAQIMIDQPYEYGCDVYLTGFVPLTEAEKKKAENKRVKDAEARKRRSEKVKAQELATLQKLKQKYEGA